MCKTDESCGYSFIVLLRKISLIISWMRDLSWYSSGWVSVASGSREKDGNSVPTDCPAPQGSLPRVSSHMPSELLLHFFFLVFFKAAVVGLSAWCPWIVAFSVLWVMNSKHCLAADAIFIGAELPPQSRPGMFSDTTLPGRTYRGGGIGLVLVLISELAAVSQTLGPRFSILAACSRMFPT